MQRMIVLRGVMASGKSTIAKRYRNFNNKILWHKIDNFKDFLSPDSSPETLPFVHGAANASLEYFLKEGFSIVMEGVFQNPEYIQQAVELAKKYQIPCKVFQLKVSLNELQKRDKVREGVPEGCRKPLGDEEIARIYQVVETNPYLGAIELNTENLAIDDCINFIDKQYID